MDTSRIAVCSIVVGLAIAFLPQGLHAQIKPGEVIGASNAVKVKDLVSPGVYYAVQHDMRMNIVPSQRIDWPPPYKDATEKYSGQVRLSEDHRSLVGYVAGQPFPLIDPNDPYAATKIMWNEVFRPITTDDYDLRFFECEHQYFNPGHPQFQIEYINVGHYAGYSLVGRTEVDPLPIDPDFKVTNRYWMFALYPLLAPFKARGAGLIRYRYADPNRGDDSWSFDPRSRRVRRLNESTLNASISTAVQTTNYDPDHYSGFNAKTEFYDYKLLGEKTMLACVNAKNSPEVTCPYDGGGSVCPENWENRHLYIVEARARRDRISEAVQSKNICYVDSEMWFFPYVDTYDHRNELYQVQLFWLAYRDRPVSDARVAIYPFKRSFVVAADRIDVQSGFTDVCYLPGKDTPERECWYINMGAINKEFCTTQAMVQAAFTAK